MTSASSTMAVSEHAHALKFQAVTAPDGLITQLFGPVEGRRHDSGVLGESGLMMLTHCPNTCRRPIKGQHLLRPMQQRFSTKMSKARVAVEWSFRDISSQWVYLAIKKQQKVLLQPDVRPSCRSADKPPDLCILFIMVCISCIIACRS